MVVSNLRHCKEWPIFIYIHHMSSHFLYRSQVISRNYQVFHGFVRFSWIEWSHNWWILSMHHMNKSMDFWPLYFSCWIIYNPKAINIHLKMNGTLPTDPSVNCYIELFGTQVERSVQWVLLETSWKIAWLSPPMNMVVFIKTKFLNKFSSIPTKLLAKHTKHHGSLELNKHDTEFHDSSCCWHLSTWDCWTNHNSCWLKTQFLLLMAEKCS